MPTTLNDLLNLTSVAALETAEAFETVGILIDYADEQASSDLLRGALGLADELAERGLTEEEAALLDYFRANAWHGIYRLRLGDRAAVWSWDQPEIQEQILCLRRALRGDGFGQLPSVRRCEILTNLGNQLDTVGRFVEAQELWTRALEIEPDFWMARGNRGRALMHYANALYDPGHEDVFALHAHGDLLAALVSADRRPEWGDPSVPPLFGEAAAAIGRAYNLEAIEAAYTPDEPSLKLAEDGAYRRWCLMHRLYLNPLNDVTAQSIAAQDVLTLPTFVTGLDEPPVVIGFFNQLKQEFVSARWLYYCGRHSDGPHPSDRDVLLFNTLDYPVYGLATEKTKLAFRMAYSLFDKSAYFLNHYLKVGIPEKKVDFRSIWTEKKGGQLRDLFERSENWPLRGLYWISRDLFEPGVKDVTEPDAEALHELRNHLEHKYVKVHELGVPRKVEAAGLRDPFFDDLAYSITEADLQRRTLRILKLARSALISLSLGMHREEQRRAAQAGKDTLSMPMLLDRWDDEWKR